MKHDNAFTRGELLCPLSGTCDREDHDCDICITEEEEFQKQESSKECRGENNDNL